MMDLAQNTYTLIVLLVLLVVLVLVLVLVIWRENTQQHERIAKQLAELPPSPEGTERILEAVEGTRMQISSTGDELRAESRGLKGLFHQMIAVLIGVVNPKDPKK